MSKFKSVLSNDALLEVFASKKSSGDYNALDVMQWAQEAVLAKLHEQQEPSWWAIHMQERVFATNDKDEAKAYAAVKAKWAPLVTPLYAHPCVSPVSHKADCVSENAECETQDHIPDGSETVNLSLSIDTKEAQALLQTYIDSLKDWQLVPKHPDRDTLRKMFYEIFDMDGIEEEYLAARYRNMLASFPKYSADKS